MNEGVVIPESVETLLVLSALGDKDAEKALRSYLSGKELSDITHALLEPSDRSSAPAHRAQVQISRAKRIALLTCAIFEGDKEAMTDPTFACETV